MASLCTIDELDVDWSICPFSAVIIQPGMGEWPIPLAVLFNLMLLLCGITTVHFALPEYETHYH